MSHRPSLLLAALVAFPLVSVAACSSEAPTVEIVDAAPLALDAGDDAHDDLTIQVRYTDPNGDLGGGKVEVHDCRAEGIVVSYPLPSIASKAAVADGVSIGGTLTVVVPDVDVVTSSGTADACRDLGAKSDAFCVVLVDSEGNTSEGACTKTVEVRSGTGT